MASDLTSRPGVGNNDERAVSEVDLRGQQKGLWRYSQNAKLGMKRCQAANDIDSARRRGSFGRKKMQAEAKLKLYGDKLQLHVTTGRGQGIRNGAWRMPGIVGKLY